MAGLELLSPTSLYFFHLDLAGQEANLEQGKRFNLVNQVHLSKSLLDHQRRESDFIGKLYLDPIHLADPGSTRSTPIHSGVLLIHLRVPQLALPLIRSN